MANKTIILNLKCPKCGAPARAQVKKQLYKFLIYVCPECDSNVVYYDNKIDILSDKLMETMAKENKLKFTGNAIFPKKHAESTKTAEVPVKSVGEPITEEKITDLRILLNTEKDFDSFISKI